LRKGRDRKRKISVRIDEETWIELKNVVEQLRRMGYKINMSVIIRRGVRREVEILKNRILYHTN